MSLVCLVGFKQVTITTFPDGNSFSRVARTVSKSINNLVIVCHETKVRVYKLLGLTRQRRGIFPHVFSNLSSGN